MKLWLPIILLFGYIYLEIKVFVLVANHIGVLLSLVLIILGSCLGVLYLKKTGANTLQQLLLNQKRRGSFVFKYMSAILFIIPGFLTDILGLLLFLPPIQTLLQKYVNVIQVGGFSQFNYSQTPPKNHSHIETDIIEGECEEKDD